MYCPTCAATIPDTALQCPICGMPFGTQALTPGTILHQTYRIDAVLGQGGFGITYAATQLLLGTRVAIKELFPFGTVRQGVMVQPPGNSGQDWAQARSDFIAEARTLARFNHPDIVRVTHLFESGNTAYMVMEFLEGESLQARLDRQGALPPAEVQDIALRVARALDLVHAAGLLHRDLKPDNILLERSGRVVLIDFGSARSFQSGKTLQHTRLVTPGYAPLEQYSSQAKYGPYTDLYALGATLHHALTGHKPPDAPDLLLDMTLPALPMSTPARLQQATLRAMALRVADRPQSAQSFVDLITTAATAGHPIPTGPTPLPRPVSTPAPISPVVPQPSALPIAYQVVRRALLLLQEAKDASALPLLPHDAARLVGEVQGGHVGALTTLSEHMEQGSLIAAHELVHLVMEGMVRVDPDGWLRQLLMQERKCTVWVVEAYPTFRRTLADAAWHLVDAVASEGSQNPSGFLPSAALLLTGDLDPEQMMTLLKGRPGLAMRLAWTVQEDLVSPWRWRSLYVSNTPYLRCLCVLRDLLQSLNVTPTYGWSTSVKGWPERTWPPVGLEFGGNKGNVDPSDVVRYWAQVTM